MTGCQVRATYTSTSSWASSRSSSRAQRGTRACAPRDPAREVSVESIAAAVVALAQRVRRDRVQVGLGGRVAQGFLEHCVPRCGWIAALDLRGCRHPQMRGDELEV